MRIVKLLLHLVSNLKSERGRGDLAMLVEGGGWTAQACRSMVVVAAECPPGFWFVLHSPMIVPLRESFNPRMAAIRCSVPWAEKTILPAKCVNMRACRFEAVISEGGHLCGPIGSFSHNHDSRSL